MKPKNTGVWLYTPNNFDPTTIPSLAGLEAEACWFVHKIISLNAAYKHQRRRFVNISRQTMEQFVHPSQVTKLRAALLDGHDPVVVCNGDWKKGSHSLGYRLGDTYRTAVRRVEVTKRSLAAKVLRHRLRRLDKPVTADQFEAVEGYLLDWLRKVRIDTLRAYTVIDDQPDRPKRRKRRKATGAKRRARRAVSGYAKAMNRMTVDQIAHGDFDFCVCDYGRVHTPVTRLLTAARSCLSFDGCPDPLASIDIRNSQLVFFVLLLLDHRLGELADRPDDFVVLGEVKGHGDRGDRDGSGNGRTEADENVVLGEVTDTGTGTGTGGLGHLKEDEQRFIDKVIGGTIYDDLMDDHNRRHHDAKITDRKEFKHAMFRDVFYCDPSKKYVRDSRLAAIFRQQFPTIWSFICDQKQWDGKGDPKLAWKQLSRRMQQAESRFMIHGVVKRLMDHHADIALMTVHDSVICPQRHVGTVQRIIAEEFQRLGVKPKLKVEGDDQQPLRKAA